MDFEILSVEPRVGLTMPSSCTSNAYFNKLSNFLWKKFSHSQKAIRTHLTFKNIHNRSQLITSK